MRHLERYNPLAAGHIEAVDVGTHSMWRLTPSANADTIALLEELGYRQTIVTDGLWEYFGELDKGTSELAPNRELIALIDMDGTVANFDEAMVRELKQLASPDEQSAIDDDGRYVNAPHIRARRKLIRSQPGFWRSLKPYKPGFEILAVLKELGFKCHVLTKGPAHEPAGWSEKVEWCRKHLQGMPIIITEDKSLTYGRVLVDDWPDYYFGWLKHRPRGLVIAPAQAWNGDTWNPQIVRYDGNNLDEVRNRLRQAAGKEL